MPFNSDIGKPLVWELENDRYLMFAGEHIQSRMDIRDPDALQLEYTRIMMAFLLRIPAPRSIAMIGLGGGSLPKFCYRYLPNTHITVIEIDADVIALRDSFGIPPDSTRFSVRHADAADFLPHCDREFDVVLADGFDAIGLPPELASEQFYCDCKNALTPNGMLVANLHACSADYDAVLGRIQRVFDDAVCVVANSRSSNQLIFATADGREALRSLCHVRCPANFDPAAWKTLMPSMARVVSFSRVLLLNR